MHISRLRRATPVLPASDLRARWSLAGLLILVLAGCSAAGPPQESPATPSVTLSFIQNRVDEGTPRAQLRVINHEKRALTPTGLGLDWSGYGGPFRQDYETTIAPGQTLDLRIILPEPSCTDGSEPVRGIVEFRSTTVRAQLDAFGQDVLRQVWQRACDEQYVEDRVGIRIDDKWRTAGNGRASYMRGRIDLTRRDGAEEILLPRVHGSVLFDLRLVGAAVLEPEAKQGSYVIELRPSRCDDHVLAESSHSFVWSAEVQADEARPRRVVLTPSLATQKQGYALVDRACQ